MNELTLLRWLAAFVFSWATALPALAADPLMRDPQIEAIVADISAQRIEARVRTLASFGTRNTLSDTQSNARGIGAARRWIKAELEACSNAAGGRLRVAFDAYMEPPGRRVVRPVEIVNVVATLPGSAQGGHERVYVVSGHYDSRASDVINAEGDAPGADDDASGVAAVMEIACVMAARHFDATLVFMAVAGEEQGLLGSTHWAEQARIRRLDIAGMITNDIIGSSIGSDGQRDDRSVRLFASGLPALLAAQRSADAATAQAAREQVDAIARSGGEADTPTHQLGRYLKQVAAAYVPGFEVNLIPRPDRFLRGGDQLPFLERGYAAVRFTEPAEDYRHQHQDVRTLDGVQYGDLPDFVDFSYIAQVARVNAAGLASLALAPSVPKQVGVEVVRLEQDTTLRWSANPEPDLAGYRIVWRAPAEPVWTHFRDVGKVTRYTLKGVSKDDYVFGLVAVDRVGHSSPAGFAEPWRPRRK